ncbi:Fc.00g090240.m01.CDS01 [Cosmosporella sp. VM-42]
MEFAKVSPAFVDALGGVDVQGRNLSDVVVPSDRDRVLAIRGQLHEEQTRVEPNYLPPILGRLDHIIQGLGFGAEEVGRFQLERQYYLTFNGPMPRNYLVRIGLAKEGSIYFVVLYLDLQAHFTQPNPSRVPQDAPQGYGSQPPTPQSSYGQHTPVSATFDQARPRYSDGGLGSRPLSGLSATIQPNLSPGSGPGAPSYAASPSRPEYPGPSSYQIPRSELSPVTRPPPRPAYQLPPIRAQPEQSASPGDQAWSREDRSSRVDIGGLIDKPDTPGRPH